MIKYRSAALALAACAASLTVAACSTGTPTASSSGTSTAAPNQSGSAAAASSTGAPIAGTTIVVKGKLGSFPVPAGAKVVENIAGGPSLIVVFGLIAPADVSRFYATALPQAGYTVTTNATLNRAGDSGVYIAFTGHGYKGTVDSLARFPGYSVAGIGNTNVTTIIFAPTTK